MQMRYCGDSYDIVKQSLLRWLSGFGEWSVHPMFTEPVSPCKVAIFQRLLGAKIVSDQVLRAKTDRSAYFEKASRCGHLFLDPDTGLRLDPKQRRSASKYVFASELCRLSQQRPNSLTLVFDQSFDFRMKRENQLKKKMERLSDDDVLSFAYVSHACFIFASHKRSLLEQARKDVIQKSGLPEDRFLEIPTA